MVFENLGSLRYHALWAYSGIVAALVIFDKVDISSVESAVALLAPYVLVISADIAKHRSD